MINQLVFILFFLFSLCLFSSCTIFGSGDSGEKIEEEDYYSEGQEEESEQAMDEETGEAHIEEEEVYYIDEEDEDILEAEEGGDIEVEDNTFTTDESVDYADADIDTDTDSSFFSPDKSSVSSKSLAPKRKWISYKKIRSQPYKGAGFLVNAVYIARPGEDIQSISNTIFSSDQVSQLYAINLHLKARNVKVGDKIYYQSPNRPHESSQLLFYFEDNGIQPSYHQVREGENIRTVASQLLGHSDSWKEIWATNPDLQSKGKLDKSVTIKYWSAVGDEPTQPSPLPQPVVSDEQQPSVSPPTSSEDVVPSVEEGKQESTLVDESKEGAPLPPSEDSPIESPSSTSFMEKMRNFAQLDMVLAGILALVGLICALIIIKKRMSKKKEFDYTAASFEIDE